MIKSTTPCTRVFLGAMFLISVLVMSNGCMNQPEVADKPILSVSILPQKYFVEKICGDQFSLQVMIPPGESPATYDPTPGQMISLAKSQVYLLSGHLQFEKSWIIGLKDELPAVKFFDTSEGIIFEHMENDASDHSHEGIDPHTWMSANNVKTIASNIVASLSSVYPEKKETYEQNFRNFIVELDSLDERISRELEGLKNRSFIIYHPALTYFARDYNLTQIPIENEGKEPSAKYMRSLIDIAEAGSIKAILVQKQFNQQEAVTIKNEIDGKLILIDPLDERWMEQMLHITDELKAALN